MYPSLTVSVAARANGAWISAKTVNRRITLFRIMNIRKNFP
ncbi:uncharacterized protein CHAB577_0514 [Chlamydia abortus]|nr:uncharacterized protein CHAB577_0514 [Chlamydia abortus]